jgi:hypothetical protein
MSTPRQFKIVLSFSSTWLELNSEMEAFRVEVAGISESLGGKLPKKPA